MSTAFAVYRVSDGLVLRTGSCSDPDHVDAQAQDGEAVSVDIPDDLVADGRWRWTSTAFVQDAPPAPTLDQAKAAKLATLADYADARLVLWSGGSAPAGGLDVDDVSTGRLTSWATQALVSKMTGAAFRLSYWILADNSHHAIASADDFLAFAEAAATYKTGAILNNAAIKAAINAAADETALAAIDITQGWPS